METSGNRGAGPLLLAVGGAFLTGLALAKIIDWMGHGHPKQ